MGGPLSTFFADLVIEEKIEKVISKHPKWKSKVDWVRKADDTFMVWTDSIDQLEEFHQYLDSLHPTIKWSKQIEENGQLPYLDILIIKTPNGNQTTVYRKPSHSDRYTHFTTAQAWKEKIITITTLRQRAEIYCSTEELKQKELEHLEQTFICNGYPQHIINRYLYQNQPTSNSTEEQSKGHFYAPYHPLAHNLFKKLQQKFNISPLYKKLQHSNTFSTITDQNNTTYPPQELYMPFLAKAAPNIMLGKPKDPLL